MSQYEQETEAFEMGQEWEQGFLGEEEAPGFLGESEQGFLGEAFEAQGFIGETGELNETMELELAAELLEIQSEEELEEFLGSLVKRVAKGVGGFVRSPIGRALGGVLKNVAKKALPVVGGALGSMVAPGVGTALGSKLGTMASGLFEVGELESMDREQAEFETARRVVRLSAVAARNAAFAPPGAPPRLVAQRAVTAAARQVAPGLLRGPGYAGSPAYGAGGPVWDGGAAPAQSGYSPPTGRRRSGRWYRRGNRITVVGV